MAKFEKWLDTLIDEKGLDRQTIIEVEGPSGMNCIPLDCLLDRIKNAPISEQEKIKATLVKIDFLNGDIMHFFRHLAGAIAI